MAHPRPVPSPARDGVDALVTQELEAILERLCTAQRREVEGTMNAGVRHARGDVERGERSRDALTMGLSAAGEAALDELCVLLRRELGLRPGS